MNIYPALDLLDGKCVRLQKGDFDRQTIYSDDPQTLVRRFEEAGAQSLHLVDLSGAKDPQKRQLEMIRTLARTSSLKIQCGGGVRSLDGVRALFDCGIERVVIGSLAVNQPTLTQDIIREFGGQRITLAIDVAPVKSENGSIDYFVAIEGWKKITTVRVADLVADFSVDRILCTDISLDGMMQGPNVRLYQCLLHQFPKMDFQASGGITVAKDLNDLANIGIRSAVIGKAIYEGSINLKEIMRGTHAH